MTKGCSCKACGGDTTVPNGRGIHRRRKCVKCGTRFSTLECDGKAVIEAVAVWLESIDRPMIAKQLRGKFE